MKVYSAFLTVILIMLFINMKGDAQWIKTNGTGGSYTHCFALDDTYLYVGMEEGGVSRTTNSGESWESINNGLSSGAVHSLCVKDSNIFAGVDSQVYLSTNRGTSWKLIRLGTQNSIVFSIVANDSNLFIGIYSTAPNGEGGGVYRSTNNGIIWSEVNTGLTSRSIQILLAKGTNVYAGAHDGLFLSTNNGSSWSDASSDSYYSDIRAILVNDTNIYVGTNGSGVLHSTDSGNSWNATNLTLQFPYVSSLVAIGSNLFAGTYLQGVHMTTDDDTLWTSIGKGLTNNNVITLISNGEYLFAGTSGYVVWRRPLSEMINTNSVQSLPASNISSKVYPNPFTSSTTISYTLPKHDMVTIEVFDILGRKIQTLANEVMDAGPHSVIFNGENLPLGMYTVKITSGASSEEMKVVLSK